MSFDFFKKKIDPDNPVIRLKPRIEALDQTGHRTRFKNYRCEDDQTPFSLTKYDVLNSCLFLFRKILFPLK